jgi:hypothetical protein
MGTPYPAFGSQSQNKGYAQCLAVLEFVVGCQKLGDRDGQLLKGRWLCLTEAVFLQQLNVVKLAVCVE